MVEVHPLSQCTDRSILYFSFYFVIILFFISLSCYACSSKSVFTISSLPGKVSFCTHTCKKVFGIIDVNVRCSQPFLLPTNHCLGYQFSSQSRVAFNSFILLATLVFFIPLFCVFAFVSIHISVFMTLLFTLFFLASLGVLAIISKTMNFERYKLQWFITI